ncbi:unnamed protein product, partial [Didymodactylos carnosus]
LKTKQQQMSIENKDDDDDNNNDNTYQQMLYNLVKKYSLLKSLVTWYSDSVQRFAMALYALGGRITYEFVRMNLSGALPNLIMLQTYISNADLKLTEGEFRFDSLQQHLYSINTKYGFGSEDCTGVIRQIKYDKDTNTFIEFCTPLTNGIPTVKHFQTESLERLKTWFSTVEKAPLLNVHMFQPVVQFMNQSSSFLISAYGVNSRYTSVDIIRRWSYIYEECNQKGIRMIGFSIDCDSKYLRAMRLAMGFFADVPNSRLFENPDAFVIKIFPTWTWFFLRNRQLLLFIQDPIHLATKWRNRMLSKTAQMIIGQQTVNLQHLADIIDDDRLSKIDHGLTISDLNPRDRQNFQSCSKITSEDVLQILHDNTDTQATYLYLQLLKYIIMAYIDKSTPIDDRLYYSWVVVFVCRFWSTWIKYKSFINKAKTTNKNNDKYFITMPAYWSVKINAHNLLYLILLVQQQQLPAHALNIFLFNSQACESICRNTRALSGCYSTRKDDLLPVQNMMNIDDLHIEEIILKAYKQVQKYIGSLNMAALFEQNHAYELNDLSTLVKNYLKTTSKMKDCSKLKPDYDFDADERTSTEINDDNDDDENSGDDDDEKSDDDDYDENGGDGDEDDDENNMITTEKTTKNTRANFVFLDITSVFNVDSQVV